jgi:competence protein ComEA
MGIAFFYFFIFSFSGEYLMFKKLLLTVMTLIAAMGFAFAQVDVNKADQAALDGIKGVGPKISKDILEERKKGGDFKDWADLQKRIHGIADKKSTALSQAGLVVNGQAKPNAPAADKKDKSAHAKVELKKENVSASSSASAVASTPAAPKK